MVRRPDGLNAFEFCILAGLRAAQLQRGCAPRVPPCDKVAVTALHEIAEQKVVVELAVVTEPEPEPVA
jgi:DNA-directed RNA polymerase subunit K/omega